MGFVQIPQLSTLCLRVIVNSKCQTEQTFAPIPTTTTLSDDEEEKKEGRTQHSSSSSSSSSSSQPRTRPSSASRLLRSFNHRPTLQHHQTMEDFMEAAAEAAEILVNQQQELELESSGKDELLLLYDEYNLVSTLVPSIEQIPMQRQPSIGIGSGRKAQANDIDLNHPWIGIYQPPFPPPQSSDNDNDNDNDRKRTVVNDNNNDGNNDGNIPMNPGEQLLVSEFGSCALDLLQCYIDTLIEAGRMDDTRLGYHFFQEFKINIQLCHDTKTNTKMSTTAAGAQQQGSTPTTTTAADPHATTDMTMATATTAMQMQMNMNVPIPKKKKRKRGGSSGVSSAAERKKELEKRAAEKKVEAARQAAILAAVPKSRGSLSLHNTIMATNTMSHLISSNVLYHISNLDLTGIQTLTDLILSSILVETGYQLKRLSVKNCRRLTDLTLHNLGTHSSNLVALDIGGDYNINTHSVIDVLTPTIVKRGRGVYTTTKLPHLTELHASGIGNQGGWTDELLPGLFGVRGWSALSIGFSPYLTFEGWKNAIFDVESKQTALQLQAEQEGGTTTTTRDENMCQTLQSLAVPFCEQTLVTNAWLGLMGRHLPNLRALDVRGNHQLTSLTGWYDGRATISHMLHSPQAQQHQSLLILARYSGVNENSVKDTKQIYPMGTPSSAYGENVDPLKVVLSSSDGIGWGILRQEEHEEQQQQGDGDGDDTNSALTNHFRYRIGVAAKKKEFKDAIDAKAKAEAVKIAEAAAAAAEIEAKAVVVASTLSSASSSSSSTPSIPSPGPGPPSEEEEIFSTSNVVVVDNHDYAIANGGGEDNAENDYENDDDSNDSMMVI